MGIRDFLRLLLDPGVILGAIGFALAMFIATLLLLLMTRTVPSSAGVPTPAITIVSFPTATQKFPTSTPLIPVNTPASPQPTYLPGNLFVGAFVQITGTGGDGLRLRLEPGLEGKVLFLGQESEIFRVHDGPQETDGHTWWLLVAPDDETRKGWAVSEYLVVIEPTGTRLHYHHFGFIVER